jgi:hypothetical protein
MNPPPSSPSIASARVTPSAWRAARRALSSTRATIVVVRWLVVALLLALALLDPVPGWAGVPAWAFVLAFAGYKLVVDLVRRRRGWDRFRQPIAALDLAVAGGLYLLGLDYDGPLYTLVFLVAVTAATTLTPRAAVLYTIAAAAVIIIAELALRRSSPPTW